MNKKQSNAASEALTLLVKDKQKGIEKRRKKQGMRRQQQPQNQILAQFALIGGCVEQHKERGGRIERGEWVGNTGSTLCMNEAVVQIRWVIEKA